MARRPAAKPTTLVDIARACGVSRWAVSAVLFPNEKNRHVGVGEDTRTRIHEAVERLGYRPHRASRGMQSRTHGAVGVLASQFFAIPWHSIDAMLRVAAAHQQVLSFESLAAAPDALPLFVRENVVDGLVTFEPLAPAIEREIALHRIPVVRVNTSQRNVPNSIVMDEAAAIVAAIRHLAEQRYRRVTLIVQKGTALYERERIAALQQTCAKEGLPAARILSFAEAAEFGEQARMLAEPLAGRAPCDAIIAPHDGVVALVYQQARVHGRTIPGDLGVMCLQDPGRLLLYDPAVSGFALPEARLGELAIELLHRRIRDAATAESIVLPYPLSIRDSSLRR